MLNFPYWKYDGIGLAELLKKKEITSHELIDTVISRIEEKNPSINAVIHKMYEQARSSVELAGNYASVPMLLKVITQEIKQEPI